MSKILSLDRLAPLRSSAPANPPVNPPVNAPSNAPANANPDLARRPGRFAGRRSALLAGLLAGSCVASLASSAGAHGPTVEITAEGLRPPLLNLYLGTTVHFAQTVATPKGVTVEIEREDEKTKGPVLAAPGDGWHYTFEQAGRHSVRLAERPAATMTIVVVPRRAP